MPDPQPYPLRPWKCQNGHTFGQIVKDNGSYRLLLYRNAVRLETDPGDVIAELVGSVDNICCSICGDARSWFADAERTQELVERVREYRAG